jgi:hypothetical protein
MTIPGVGPVVALTYRATVDVPARFRNSKVVGAVFGLIVLQKSPSRLCEIEICNNRIGASVLLNRCCSFVPDLESMFRDQMPKILLQHNLPIADIPADMPRAR